MEDQEKKKENLPPKEPSLPKSKRASTNYYMKFAGMAFQFFIPIMLGAWLGTFLDAKYESNLFVVLFVLLGFFAALYLILKDLTKK